MTHPQEVLGLAGISALLSRYLPPPQKKYLVAKQSFKLTSWSYPLGPQMFLNGGNEVIGWEGRPGLGGGSGDLEARLCTEAGGYLKMERAGV